LSFNIDFSIASSKQIETAICRQVENIRLSRNITRRKLAAEAGVSERTVARLEKGEGVSLDTFIRILIAFGLQQNLKTLLPDPTIRPVDRIALKGSQRKRARSKSTDTEPSVWSWADGGDEDE
jgi:transcriptional regulator with XRE-family HTH domain